MRSLHQFENNQLIPIVLGIFIGCLIIADFYITNILAQIFDHSTLFRIIPFEVSLILLSLIIITAIFAANVDRINILIEKREKIFIILLIIGLHTIGISPSKIDSSDIILAILLFWWFITVFTSERYKIINSPLHLLNVALLIFALLSAINGGIFIILSMFPLVKAIVTSFLIIDIVRRKELVIFFIKTLFIVTTISAVIAIFQEILYLYNGTILFFYDKKFLKLLLEPTPFGTFLRVPAFTSMHLFLANYLVLCLLLGLNAFLYFNAVIRRWERFLLIVSLSLMAIALLLTFSKTNILGFSFGVVISICMKWSSRLIHFLMLALLFVVVAYLVGLGDWFYEYVTVQMELLGELGERVELMRRGVEGFLYKHPFIGAGVGLGKNYTQDIVGWGVHNAFIRAADDIGIFGFLVYTAIFTYGFLRLILTIRTIHDPKMRVLLKILIAGFIAYFIDIQFQPDFLSYYNWILIGFIESCVIVLRKEAKKIDKHSYTLT